MKQLFRSGDIVKFGTLEGELQREVTANGVGLCLVSHTVQRASFNEDGSMSGYLSAFGCVLTLVQRPKRMVVKFITRWFNLEQNGNLQGPYVNLCDAEADSKYPSNIQVELSGEYEVEEK